MNENRSTNHDRWGGPHERERCLREARRYLPEAEAEDAVQEALVAAWRKTDAWMPASGPLPLLLTITRFKALQTLRRRRPEASPDLLERPVEDSELAATPLRLDVARALERLSDDDRALIEMRYHDDLTQRALASELGIPEGTVKVRLHRLRAQLRGSLDPEGVA